MEKSHTEFLQECQEELARLKAQIAALEEKIAGYESVIEDVPAEAEEVDFTGVEFGVGDIPVSPEDIPVPSEDIPANIIEAEVVSSVANKEVDAPSETSPASNDETANLPWRKDNPGILVKNIRSGISLLDRAQFIGTLFKEDFALYDATIAELNNMETLDQAVAYVKANFPQWNLGSDVVYRFMMAVRKKLG